MSPNTIIIMTAASSMLGMPLGVLVGWFLRSKTESAPQPPVTPELQFPVTYQLPCQDHKGKYYLFVKDDVWTVPPMPGTLLGNCGIPNVMGPHAGFDNRISHVGYDGNTRRAMLTLFGFREGAMALDEIKVALPGWTYKQELVNPEDMGDINPITRQ